MLEWDYHQICIIENMHAPAFDTVHVCVRMYIHNVCVCVCVCSTLCCHVYGKFFVSWGARVHSTSSKTREQPTKPSRATTPENESAAEADMNSGRGGSAMDGRDASTSNGACRSNTSSDTKQSKS